MYWEFGISRCNLVYIEWIRNKILLYSIAPLSMGFSRQEYWSGLPCPPPGDLPHPGIELMSLKSHELAGRFFTSTTWEACIVLGTTFNIL